MSGTSAYADWIAVDWGTSHLRVWAISKDGRVLANADSDDGMGQLKPTDFEPALLGLIDPWLGSGTTPVFACGMVGSRQGWAEAAYSTAPCASISDDLTTAPTRDSRIDVKLVPGIKQLNPADVMRGEETQIGGFLSQKPDFDGILCLPGTHTKWVHISANEIVSFRTFMTGEMFELLSERSVLRHSIGEGWDEDAFDQAVADAMSRPEFMASRLFSLRAEALLHNLAPETARARLSGLLVGLELAAARPYWLGQNVVLIGADTLTALYAKALEAQGVPAKRANGAAMTLAGLAAARQRAMETAK